MKTRGQWVPLLLAFICHPCKAAITLRGTASSNGDDDPNWAEKMEALNSQRGIQGQQQAARDALEVARMGGMEEAPTMEGLNAAHAGGMTGDMSQPGEFPAGYEPANRGRQVMDVDMDNVGEAIKDNVAIEDYHSEYERLVKAERERKYGPPRTSDGNREQVGSGIGWLAPTAELRPPEVKCAEHCTGNAYCWQGECVYRPWKFSDVERKGCYADPKQPGLNSWEKNMCKTVGAVDEESCTAAARHCKWINDAPAWWRQIVAEKAEEESRLWKMQQTALKATTDANEGVKELMKHAVPGHPIFGTILGEPDRRYLTDRGTR